jgi:hypothetical protein
MMMSGMELTTKKAAVASAVTASALQPRVRAKYVHAMNKIAASKASARRNDRATIGCFPYTALAHAMI